MISDVSQINIYGQMGTKHLPHSIVPRQLLHEVYMHYYGIQ